MDEKKIRELLEDRAFLQELYKIRSLKGVQAAFKEKGLELSIEEIKKLRHDYMDTLMQTVSAELPDEELAKVSGGSEEGRDDYYGAGDPLMQPGNTT